jgi:hypothetical protein
MIHMSRSESRGRNGDLILACYRQARKGERSLGVCRNAAALARQSILHCDLSLRYRGMSRIDDDSL